MPLATALLRPP